jgi:hypothetical protein
MKIKLPPNVQEIEIVDDKILICTTELKQRYSKLRERLEWQVVSSWRELKN